MSTNRKFLAYAKEHFNGEPTEHSVAFYDDCTVPCLDTDDKNISITIEFEGSLDNPFDVERLKDFCKKFCIPLNDAADTEVLNKAIYSEDAVLEALQSATEAPLMNKLKQKIAENKTQKILTKSANAQSDLTQPFLHNEAAVKKAASTKEVISTTLKPEEAVRHYLDTLRSPRTGLYVLFEVDEENGRRREYEDISLIASSQLDAILNNLVTSNTSTSQLSEVDKLKTTAATLMLKKLKSILSSNKDRTIAGYTMDKALADKFGHSRDEGNTFDKMNPVELNEVWSQSKMAQRQQILNELLGNDDNKVPANVKGSLIAQSKPFTTASWRIVKASLDADKSISEKVYDTIIKNADLQKAISFGNDIKGLDFSQETQISMMLLAQECDRRAKSPKGGGKYIDHLRKKDDPNEWDSAEGMVNHKDSLVAIIENHKNDKTIEEGDGAESRNRSKKNVLDTAPEPIGDKKVDELFERMSKDSTLARFVFDNRENKAYLQSIFGLSPKQAIALVKPFNR